jgi:ribonuclease R
VHRLLRETFQTGDVSAKRRQKLAAMLPEIALHSSERERAAAEAERATVDLKKVEYMARFVGEEFNGIINGVMAFGIFVELENGVEGLVRVSSMEDDYYQHVEEQYALIGERTHKVYRLGDAVKVVLTRVNPEERNIDFILAPGQGIQPRTGNNGRGKVKQETKRTTGKALPDSSKNKVKKKKSPSPKPRKEKPNRP